MHSKTIPKGGICPLDFPSSPWLNCASSLTGSFSLLSSPPLPAGLVQLLLVEDQSKVTRNGCRFKGFVYVVLISCQVRAMFCPPTCFSSLCRPVFSNTASSSFDGTPVPCGFFALALQLSPRKDAVCGAVTSQP